MTEESYSGVTGTGMTPTDITFTPTGARASTTYANGITQTLSYNADGSVKTIGETGINGFAYTGYTDTYANGAIVQESFTGITGYSDGSFAVTARTAPLTELLAADTYAGGTDLYGGTLELGAVGAAGSGAIRFDGAATLQLDAGALTTTSANHFDFANLIKGATSTSQVIDLKSLTYVANQTAATLNGTSVDVSNGTSDVTLHLASTPAMGSTFKTAADGSGGTFVYDPPADTSFAASTVPSGVDPFWIAAALAPSGGTDTGSFGSGATAMPGAFGLAAATTPEPAFASISGGRRSRRSPACLT